MKLSSLILLSLVLRASTAPVAGNEDYESVEYKHDPEYTSYGETENYSKGYYGDDKSYDGDSYHKEAYYAPHRESYNKGYESKHAPTYYKRGDDESYYGKVEYGHEESKEYGDDKSYGESDYSTGYYSKESNYAPHRENYKKGYEAYAKSD
ncbi:hypothetical protein HDU98_005771 [Podochytrium sp. JEL0797]|nr:hypothetical protein HDU98_005771 [Podochytrium sp. JEL0797]